MSLSHPRIHVLALAAACLSFASPVAQTGAPASVGAVTPYRLTLRQPERVTYQVQPPVDARPSSVEARAGGGLGATVGFGPRIVLRITPDTDLDSLLQGRPLQPTRFIEPGYHILAAGDAWTALSQSVDLGEQPGVLSCRPVLQQNLRKHGPLAPQPNDPRFGLLWQLENRWPDGSRRGPDLEARAAWAVTRGEGVVVAVVDDGVELTHPDLLPAANNPYHYSFTTGVTNGLPASTLDDHATLVAGFVLARGNNGRGISGMAPQAQLASWKIFNGTTIPSSFDDELMDMFQHLPQTVAVQNHSWGNADIVPLGPTDLEKLGLDNALISGRSGLGVIMVRSAGNRRQDLLNANDDGYANDPRVIAVGAVGSTGRAADYSQPGACLLVAAFGGGSDRALTSTDRLGSVGLSNVSGSLDGGDYVSSTLLAGTSFSAPQISGLVALLLAANPALSIRDVQQILALSSRQLDLADPDLTFNAAGYQHSHNTGFGVPDAGQATTLARTWTARPNVTEQERISVVRRTIPDDGLRVVITGRSVPSELRSIPSKPGMGLHADDPTESLELVDIGLATETILLNLQGKAALIRRSPAGSPGDDRHTFEGKIRRAAEAGASFAIIYNDRDLTDRFVPGGTDYSPIPAVMIDQNHGNSLVAQMTADSTLRAQIQLSAASYSFNVSSPLVCEHVGARVLTTHSRRGDVRITLRSPQGTRSVLQHLNQDATPGPWNSWTYWSTRHFGEASLGAWTIDVSDQEPLAVGDVTRVELVLRGVPLLDTDSDGLDDDWETRWFSGLQSNPGEDPDQDGWSHAQEQVLHSDPTRLERPFESWFSRLNATHGLLGWSAIPGTSYDISTAPTPTGTFQPLTEITADSPNMEFRLPLDLRTPAFFRILQR